MWSTCDITETFSLHGSVATMMQQCYYNHNNYTVTWKEAQEYYWIHWNCTICPVCNFEKSYVLCYQSLFHIRWSSAWFANVLLLCSLEIHNLKIQIYVQLNMKKLLHCVNIQSRFCLLVIFCKKSHKSPCDGLDGNAELSAVSESMHCVGTLHWKISKYFVSFSSKTICQGARGNAASISPILCYQGYTKLSLLCHPNHPTQIKIKGTSPINT